MTTKTRTSRRRFLTRSLPAAGIASSFPAVIASRTNTASSAHYRVGVIGSTSRGNYGHGLDTVWLNLPQTSVEAVADDHDAGRTEAMRRLNIHRSFRDYRKMLDEVDLDLVAIGPRWIDQHRDMAVAAARRGIHIYMEKPFCRSPAEADEIIAACEANNVKLALAHQTRYCPTLRVMKKMIQQGRIGRVLELRGRGKEDHRGGAEDLWVLGSHIMNLIHFFAGEPRWCIGQLSLDGRPAQQRDVRPGNEGLGPLAGDQVAAQYAQGEGIMAYFNSVRRSGVGGQSRFALQIFGSEGVLEITTGFPPAAHYLADPLWSPGRSGQKWQPISSAGLNEPEPIRDAGLPEGNIAAVKDLISAIENDRLPLCNMYEGRLTVEMICAVFASHVVGQAVDLPLTTRENALTQWA